MLPVLSIVSVNKVNIGTTKLSNMNFFCILILVISRLPCLFNMANAVSLTVVHVNSDTSDSFSAFNYAICGVAGKCFLMELVPRSDERPRT